MLKISTYVRNYRYKLPENSIKYVLHIAGNIIDGVDTTSMTREQLEVFCLRIKEENEREREERNFFQMERDKLRTFWEISRNELEEARAKLRYVNKNPKGIKRFGFVNTILETLIFLFFSITKIDCIISICLWSFLTVYLNFHYIYCLLLMKA